MSEEQVSEFLARVQTDAGLQEGLARRAAVRETLISALVEAGRNHGYDFTAEECRALLAPAEPDGELEDEQLERIAGGVLNRLLEFLYRPDAPEDDPPGPAGSGSA